MRDSLRIFLSYSRRDIEIVKRIYNRIKEEGFKPWIDEEDLLPGQDWELEISKNLKSSHVVLVFLSGTATNIAGFLHKEIKIALDIADQQPEGTIFLIPVKLEECSVPDRLKLWQWVEIYRNKGFEKLINALEFRLQTLIPTDSKALVERANNQSQRETILVGDYIAKGRNTDGTFYHCESSIKQEKGLSLITWQIGPHKFSSKGVVEKDILNVFGDYMVSYVIGKDGTLNGIWGESGTEKLIPKHYFFVESESQQSQEEESKRIQAFERHSWVNELKQMRDLDIHTIKEIFMMAESIDELIGLLVEAAPVCFDPHDLYAKWKSEDYGTVNINEIRKILGLKPIAFRESLNDN